MKKPKPNAENPGMHQNASPKIFNNARKLRTRMTRAETLLWEKLSGKQLGYKFRRQHPVGNYIADFYCHQVKLILEVDGGYHHKQEQKEYDALRTKNLESVGIKVFRFSNEEFYERMENVMAQLRMLIEEIEKLEKESSSGTA
jgi:imidazole glycerol-phosphate synthase subunit HisF